MSSLATVGRWLPGPTHHQPKPRRASGSSHAGRRRAAKPPAPTVRPREGRLPSARVNGSLSTVRTLPVGLVRNGARRAPHDPVLGNELGRPHRKSADGRRYDRCPARRDRDPERMSLWPSGRDAGEVFRLDRAAPLRP